MDLCGLDPRSSTSAKASPRHRPKTRHVTRQAPHAPPTTCTGRFSQQGEPKSAEVSCSARIERLGGTPVPRRLGFTGVQEVSSGKLPRLSPLKLDISCISIEQSPFNPPKNQLAHRSKKDFRYMPPLHAKHILWDLKHIRVRCGRNQRPFGSVVQ
jgi:hypothetical protein